jgi:hypothetical protein
MVQTWSYVLSVIRVKDTSFFFVVSIPVPAYIRVDHGPSVAPHRTPVHGTGHGSKAEALFLLFLDPSDPFELEHLQGHKQLLSSMADTHGV